jgi:hypothetical protein
LKRIQKMRRRAMAAAPPPVQLPTRRSSNSPRRLLRILIVTGAFALLALAPVSPQIIPISGNNQTGNPGAPLAQPFVVQVLDEFGNPVAGHPVTFSGGFLVPDLDNGIINTIAGGGNFGDSGPALEASLSSVQGLAGLSSATFAACSPDGSVLISDSGHSLIRKVDPAGIITSIAGNKQVGPLEENAPALSTSVGIPLGLSCDGGGNVYFVDGRHQVVRKVDSTTGLIATVAGDGSVSNTLNGVGGPATQASIGMPSDVAVDVAGNLWITIVHGPTLPSFQGALLRVDAATGILTAPVTGLSASLSGGAGLVVGTSGQVLFCEPAAQRVFLPATARPDSPATGALPSPLPFPSPMTWRQILPAACTSPTQVTCAFAASMLSA